MEFNKLRGKDLQIGKPRKDGQYICRMLSKKGNHFYDFLMYYKGRGFLTNMKVTHWLQIENPCKLDQD